MPIQRLIVWCERDKSYSLIEDNEAICDSDVIQVGQTINFFYDKKQYQGKVIEIGEDDDYDSMLLKLRELNATNKENRESFHAERPRKNRGKRMNQMVQSLKPKPKPTKEVKSRKKLVQKKITDENCLLEETSESSRSREESSIKQQSCDAVALQLSHEENFGDQASFGNNDDDEYDHLTNRMNVTMNNDFVGDEVGGNNIHPLERLFTQQYDSDLASTEEDEGSDQFQSPPSSPLPEMRSTADAKARLQAKRKLANQGKDADISILKKLRTGETTKVVEMSRERRASSPVGSSGSKAGSSNDRVQSPCNGLFSHRKPASKVVTSRSQASAYVSSGGNEAGKSDDCESPCGRQKSPALFPKRRVSIFGPMLDDEKNKLDGTADIETYEDSEEEDDEEKSNAQKSKTGKRPGKRGGKKKESDLDDLEGKDELTNTPSFEMLRHAKRQPGENVVEVRGRSQELANKFFYVDTKALQDAKVAVNATTFSKQLLVAAFSDRALWECTLSGGEYRAGGRGNFRKKPALNQDIVAVILDVTLKRQTVKKWSPPATKRDIQAGLRQKLIDMRPRLKKLFGGDAEMKE